jgi:large subunit ribosomal protein L10
MVTEAKRANVAFLADLIRPSQCMIVTDYRGLNTPEMNALRNDLQNTTATYRVIKNRLMKVAAEQTGSGALAPLLEGPSAVVFCQDEFGAAVRVLRDFMRGNQNLNIRGGLLGGQPLNTDEVMALATMPGREQLQAELVGAIAGPLTQLAGLLGPQGPAGEVIRILDGAAGGLVRVFEARAEQLGGAAA